MSNIALQILINAKDEASKVIAGLAGQVRSAQSASLGFAGVLGGASVAVGGLGIAALNAAGSMEQADVAFRTILRSGEKAAKLREDLNKFTITTPFELEQTQELAKRLIAYRVAQEDLIPTMTVLGNIAAGVGTEKLPQLVYAFGQIRGAGRLLGPELRQLTETGAPIIEELARVTGHSVADISSKSGELGITFAQVEQALKNLGTGGGMFAGLMEAQSKTFFGAMSNVKDSIYMFLSTEGNKFLNFFRDGALALGEFIRGDLPKIAEKVYEMGVAFANNTPLVVALTGAILGGLSPAFLAAAGSIASATLALLPWMAAGAALAGLAYLIYQAYETNFYGFRDIVNNVLTWIQQKWAEWGPVITAKAQEIVSFLTQKWQEWGPIVLEETTKALTFLRQKWDEYAPLVQAAVTNVSDKITTAFNAIRDFIDTHGTEISAAFRATWDTIKLIVTPALLFIKFMIESTLTLIGGVAKVFLQLLAGDFGGAWETIKSTAVTLWGQFATFLQGVWDGVLKNALEWIGKMVNEAGLLPGKITGALADLAGTLADVISKAMKAALDAMIEGAKGLVNEAIKTAQNIANALNPANMFGGGEKFLKFEGGGIGKRASGGPVAAGMPYIVGEQGPELFIPAGAGNILPNSRLQPAIAGAGSGGSNILFDFRGSTLLSENTAKQITDLVIQRLQKTSRIPSR